MYDPRLTRASRFTDQVRGKQGKRVLYYTVCSSGLPLPHHVMLGSRPNMTKEGKSLQKIRKMIDKKYVLPTIEFGCKHLLVLSHDHGLPDDVQGDRAAPSDSYRQLYVDDPKSHQMIGCCVVTYLKLP